MNQGWIWEGCASFTPHLVRMIEARSKEACSVKLSKLKGNIQVTESVPASEPEETDEAASHDEESIEVPKHTSPRRTQRRAAQKVVNYADLDPPEEESTATRATSSPADDNWTPPPRPPPGTPTIVATVAPTVVPTAAPTVFATAALTVAPTVTSSVTPTVMPPPSRVAGRPSQPSLLTSMRLNYHPVQSYRVSQRWANMPPPIPCERDKIINLVTGLSRSSKVDANKEIKLENYWKTIRKRIVDFIDFRGEHKDVMSDLLDAEVYTKLRQFLRTGATYLAAVEFDCLLNQTAENNEGLHLIPEFNDQMPTTGEAPQTEFEKIVRAMIKNTLDAYEEKRKVFYPVEEEWKKYVQFCAVLRRFMGRLGIPDSMNEPCHQANVLNRRAASWFDQITMMVTEGEFNSKDAAIAFVDRNLNRFDVSKMQEFSSMFPGTELPPSDTKESLVCDILRDAQTEYFLLHRFVKHVVPSRGFRDVDPDGRITQLLNNHISTVWNLRDLPRQAHFWACVGPAIKNFIEMFDYAPDLISIENLADLFQFEFECWAERLEEISNNYFSVDDQPPIYSPSIDSPRTGDTRPYFGGYDAACDLSRAPVPAEASAMLFIIKNIASRTSLHDDMFKEAIEGFFRATKETLPAHFATLNVHLLHHLPQYLEKHGSINNASAFPFESALGLLSRCISSFKNPLAQIERRVMEGKTVFGGPYLAPKSPVTTNYRGHACYQSTDGRYIQAVAHHPDFVWAIEYTHYDDVYTHPFPSNLIGVVRAIDGTEMFKMPYRSLSRVCWAMPAKEGVLIVPINHLV
ncbi:unnamed protein product [Cyprideis torosa]|uniref:Uncharacterized protein n=1 Tax=Cyprideis torosa TaxID=163714 RepID=A0A7R8WG82_9CRUS|nr:unnamed protein product [Cyprideis torosa]CAG0897868.1 unnamed protein product [Cyprideis torosa]